MAILLLFKIENLKNEIEFLKGMIYTKNRKIFWASSEQVDVNQLSLFNDAEKFSDSKIKEHTLEEITYKRTKKITILVKLVYYQLKCEKYFL